MEAKSIWKYQLKRQLVGSGLQPLQRWGLSLSFIQYYCVNTKHDDTPVWSLYNIFSRILSLRTMTIRTRTRTRRKTRRTRRRRIRKREKKRRGTRRKKMRRRNRFLTIAAGSWSVHFVCIFLSKFYLGVITQMLNCLVVHSHHCGHHYLVFISM